MNLLIANTIIGKPGNIGFRLSKLIDQKPNYFYVIARGIYSKKYAGISLGIIGHISRAINAIRRYYLPSFNSRAIDIFIFDISVLIILHFKVFNSKPGIAYICESTPRISKYLKKRGWHIVWDVPISPSTHVKNLHRKGLGESMIFNPYLDKLEREMALISDGIICPSTFVANILSEMGAQKSKLSIIPFGVTKPPSQKNDIHAEDKIVIGFLGNISARKGVDLLIESWNKSEIKKFGGTLLLQGNLYPEIRKMELDSSIKIIEFGDTEEFFKKINIFIFPSFMEGSAKVIYESISYRVPVVTSKYSGAPPFSNKFLEEIEPLSSDSLTKKLNELLQSRPLQIPSKLVDEFCSKYSWDNYALKVFSRLNKF